MNVRSLLQENIPIINVWNYNFDEQLKVLSDLTHKYNIIAFVLHSLTRTLNSQATISKNTPSLPTIIKKKLIINISGTTSKPPN